VKKSLVLGVAMLACGASAGVVSAVASGQHGAVDPGRVVSASAVAPTIITGQGWQGDFVYTVPTGASGLFFHYGCPNGLTPDAGKFVVGFSDPAANTVHLIGEGIRTDINSHEWQWNINWFGGGSPAGAQITFNVHCSKK
jgi:hypothetical protein